MSSDLGAGGGGQAGSGKHQRADARRNVGALIEAARSVFATRGIDAPVREIAERAGMGVGTVYRHFPRRPELVAAVFAQEIDDCAGALRALSTHPQPFTALKEGMLRFVELGLTKRGLAVALHAGDPAFEGMRARREERLRPAFHELFQKALTSGAIRGGIDADEVLNAAASLCSTPSGTRPDAIRRMAILLVDGLRPIAEEIP